MSRIRCMTAEEVEHILRWTRRVGQFPGGNKL
jgi:hypothetical protein